MPLFTIITPVKNAVKSISKTVESVTYQDVDFEYIIVDGGSSDGTLEFLNKIDHPKIRVISIKDRCIAEAINTGVERAKGSIISILDADDSYFEDALPKVELIIASNPKIDVYCFSMRLSGKGIDYFFTPKNPINMKQGMIVNHTATFFKKGIIDEGFRYSLDYKIVSDWDFLLSLQSSNKKFSAFSHVTTLYSIGGISTRAISLIKIEMHKVRKKYSLYKYIDWKYIKILLLHLIYGDQLIIRSHKRNQSRYRDAS